MRDFFKSELKTLKAKTGLNQYENLSAMPDANFQFKILLDSMESACNEFPYIPDNDKKRIIQEQIVRDQDFTGLNSRVIWKWLNANKDHYWAVQQMKQEPQSHQPAPPEVADKYAKQLLENISKIGIVTSPQPREERLPDSVLVKSNYTPPSEIEIERRKLHIKFLQEWTDVRTGKFKEGAPLEEDWISEQLSKK